MQVLEISANQVSIQSNKTRILSFQNSSKLKTCRLKSYFELLDEKMQTIAVEKITSEIKKYHSYSKPLAI